MGQLGGGKSWAGGRGQDGAYPRAHERTMMMRAEREELQKMNAKSTLFLSSLFFC